MPCGGPGGGWACSVSNFHAGVLSQIITCFFFKKKQKNITIILPLSLKIPQPIHSPHAWML